jgi:hypothetical protein
VTHALQDVQTLETNWRTESRTAESGAG